MVLDMIEKTNQTPLQNDEDTRRVIQETISLVNRKFESKQLQHPTPADKEAVDAYIRTAIPQAEKKLDITLNHLVIEELAQEIKRRVLGLGFLDELLPPARTDLSEITLYSDSGQIAVMEKGSVRWTGLDMHIKPAEAMRVIGLLLSQDKGRALTEATPIIAAKLRPTPENPGGGRINVVHPVCAGGKGPSMNIRLYEQNPVEPEQLLRWNVVDQPMLDYIAEEIVQKGARFLVTGGTRTGKTTFLSAVTNFLPYEYRVVTIEDPIEIWLPRPSVQQLEARPVPPGIELTEVSLADLLATTMRMSPDYMIVGEVREGRAAATLLNALATGHAGACTYHADSPRDAFTRMASEIQQTMGGSVKSANYSIANAFDYIIQINIVKEVRRVTMIGKVEKELRNGNVWYTPAYKYDWESPAQEPRWFRPEDTEKEE